MTRRAKVLSVERKPTVKPARLVPEQTFEVVSFGGSGEAVLQFSTTRFLPQWGTTDFGQVVTEIKRTRELGCNRVSIYLDWLIWNNDGGRYTYAGTARVTERLHSLFALCQIEGVLANIGMIWQADEPARDKKISDADFERSAIDLRSVTDQWAALHGVEFVVSYGYASDRRPAMQLMDRIALCNYDDNDGILRATSDIEATLRPDQSTAIIPACYHLEHKACVIEQYMAYMRSRRGRCRLLVPFLMDQRMQGYETDPAMTARVLAASNEVRSMRRSDYTWPAASVEPPPLTQWPPGYEPPQPYTDPPREPTQQG